MQNFMQLIFRMYTHNRTVQLSLCRVSFFFFVTVGVSAEYFTLICINIVALDMPLWFYKIVMAVFIFAQSFDKITDLLSISQRALLLV